jgi:hypothetical protein
MSLPIDIFSRFTDLINERISQCKKLYNPEQWAYDQTLIKIHNDLKKKINTELIRNPTGQSLYVFCLKEKKNNDLFFNQMKEKYEQRKIDETNFKNYSFMFLTPISVLNLFVHEFEPIFIKRDPENEKPHTPEIVKSDGTKFTMKEIAYLYHYNGDQITNNNKNEVVKKYGWSSGHSLIQDYNNARKRLNTKDLSYQELKNRIDIVSLIIDYVKPEKQKMINDELRKLETDLEDKRDY